MRANISWKERKYFFLALILTCTTVTILFLSQFLQYSSRLKIHKKCKRLKVNMPSTSVASFINNKIDFTIFLPTRHYGALQGLDKQETVEKYGKDQVNVWRRWESGEMKRRELNRREMNGIDREIIDERGAADGEKKWKRRNKTEQSRRKGENEYDWSASYSIEMHEEARGE